MMTHLNPQNDRVAVGHDLVEFICKDENSRDVMIDNWHADISGKKSNTANRMIEHQDRYTFVNQGDTERTVTLNLDDNDNVIMLWLKSYISSNSNAVYFFAAGSSSYIALKSLDKRSLLSTSSTNNISFAPSYGNSYVTSDINAIA